MKNKEAELLNKLRAIFKIEAQERLEAMYKGLLELEKAQDAERQNSLIEVVYREAHSLKGATRAVNASQAEKFCQELESALALIKKREVPLTQAVFDLLHRAVDKLAELFNAPDGEQTDTSEIIGQLARLKQTKGSTENPAGQEMLPEASSLAAENVEKGQPPSGADRLSISVLSTARISEPVALMAASVSMVPERSIRKETVRVPTAKLDAVLIQAEELLASKLAIGQLTEDLKGLKKMLDVWEKEWAKVGNELRFLRQFAESKSFGTPDNERVKFARLWNFQEWNSAFMTALENNIKEYSLKAENDGHILNGIVNNLLEDVKKLTMLPFASLLESLPKVVRDLSRSQGKEVELLIEGGYVEVDKRILEEMKDPLLHLVRNCIDHGISLPEERIRRNKPERGILRVSIAQIEGNKVEIIVADDGEGIDLIKVKKVALNNGIISTQEAEKLSDRETLELIFQSDVSTSEIITEISGRGLGLAIVRDTVAKLQGNVTVESIPQVSTTFRIQVPVTLATARGVLVRIKEQIFVIPTVNVDQVIRVKREEIKTVENRDTIFANGRAIPLVKLKDVLELGGNDQLSKEKDYYEALVLTAADKHIAFRVDEVLHEQEVLVKPLAKPLARVRNIAGATILGSGKVVPILNVTDLLKSAVKAAESQSFRAQEVSGKDEPIVKSILVTEDSITSRMLLKNILEAAGYQVKTAVDGMEAFTLLRTEQFDLVLSDVEMPRMNGFELTGKIRADNRLAHVPVVLVTGLESREDRERGIDVGANAYLVKSNFDHSNLLEVIHKLI